MAQTRNLGIISGSSLSLTSFNYISNFFLQSAHFGPIFTAIIQHHQHLLSTTLQTPNGSVSINLFSPKQPEGWISAKCKHHTPNENLLLPWDKVPNPPKGFRGPQWSGLRLDSHHFLRSSTRSQLGACAFFLCHSPPLPGAAPTHPSTLSTLGGLPLPCVPDTPLQLLCNWPGFAQVCLLHSMNSTAETVSGLRGPTSCDHESLNKRFWINNNIKGKKKEKALLHFI